MTKKELLKILEGVNDNCEIILPAHNGSVNTYSVLDHVFIEKFSNSIYLDLYGTPGVIDDRLLNFKDDDEIILLSSEFPYKHTF